jgi:hypothetical protein
MIQERVNLIRLLDASPSEWTATFGVSIANIINAGCIPNYRVNDSWRRHKRHGRTSVNAIDRVATREQHKQQQ